MAPNTACASSLNTHGNQALAVQRKPGKQSSRKKGKKNSAANQEYLLELNTNQNQASSYSVALICSEDEGKSFTEKVIKREKVITRSKNSKHPLSKKAVPVKEIKKTEILKGIVIRTERKQNKKKNKSRKNKMEGDNVSVVYIDSDISFDDDELGGLHVLETSTNMDSQPVLQEKDDDVQIIDVFQDTNTNAGQEPKHICTILNCNAEFSSIENLHNHELSFKHSPCNPLLLTCNLIMPTFPQCFMCPDCDQEFWTQDDCQVHMLDRLHLPFYPPLKITAYMCAQCLHLFESSELCWRHIEKMSHHRMYFPFPDDSVTEEGLAGPVPIATELVSDLVKKCDKVLYTVQCLECGLVLENHTQLEEHREETRNQHVIASMTETNLLDVFMSYTSNFSCDICHRLFTGELKEMAKHQCARRIIGTVIENDTCTFAEFMKRCALSHIKSLEISDGAGPSHRSSSSALTRHHIDAYIKKLLRQKSSREQQENLRSGSPYGQFKGQSSGYLPSPEKRATEKRKKSEDSSDESMYGEEQKETRKAREESSSSVEDILLVEDIEPASPVSHTEDSLPEVSETPAELRSGRTATVSPGTRNPNSTRITAVTALRSGTRKSTQNIRVPCGNPAAATVGLSPGNQRENKMRRLTQYTELPAENSGVTENVALSADCIPTTSPQSSSQGQKNTDETAWSQQRLQKSALDHAKVPLSPTKRPNVITSISSPNGSFKMAEMDLENTLSRPVQACEVASPCKSSALNILATGGVDPLPDFPQFSYSFVSNFGVSSLLPGMTEPRLQPSGRASPTRHGNIQPYQQGKSFEGQVVGFSEHLPVNKVSPLQQQVVRGNLIKPDQRRVESNQSQATSSDQFLDQSIADGSLNRQHGYKNLNTGSKLLDDSDRSHLISPEYLATMRNIVFLDLDNWCGFFKKLPRCLPDCTFVWGFFGGSLNWCPPHNSYIFRQMWNKGLFYLNEKCGRTKDAADFAIVLTVGRLNEILPTHVAFTILSGDKGFHEVERQMRHCERRVMVINPHDAEKFSNDMIYAMVTSVTDT